MVAKSYGFLIIIYHLLITEDLLLHGFDLCKLHWFFNLIIVIMNPTQVCESMDCRRPQLVYLLRFSESATLECKGREAIAVI